MLRSFSHVASVPLLTVVSTTDTTTIEVKGVAKADFKINALKS